MSYKVNSRVADNKSDIKMSSGVGKFFRLNYRKPTSLLSILALINTRELQITAEVVENKSSLTVT
jgi:hypothetical protein